MTEPGTMSDPAPTAAVMPVGYVRFTHEPVDRTIDCGDGAHVDVGVDGRIVGIETLGHADFLRAAYATLRALVVADGGGVR